MIFRDKRHEQLFHEFDSRMHSHDCYYKPVAYLLALDAVCREHATAIFNFEESCIKPECLNCDWQTSTSLKTCRLAFNLYNGYCYSGETYTDTDGYKIDLPDKSYSPYYLFDTEYAPFYWQAIKLHLPNIA